MQPTPRHSLTLLTAALPFTAAMLAMHWWQRPVRVARLGSQPVHYVIDLNTADRRTLQLLPGIGDSLANAIADHRDRVGGFDEVADLEDIPGIGETTRRRVEPWVILSPSP